MMMSIWDMKGSTFKGVHDLSMNTSILSSFLAFSLLLFLDFPTPSSFIFLLSPISIITHSKISTEKILSLIKLPQLRIFENLSAQDKMIIYKRLIKNFVGEVQG